MATGFLAQGGKFGSDTVNDAGGAVSDLLSSEATSSSLRLKAQGDWVEGQNYTDAATLAKQNEEFTEQSTAVKQVMADRQIYQGLGTEQADIAGAGFSDSGSSLDLMRSSAAQGALQKAVLGQQGLITEAGYDEQATSYTKLAALAASTAGAENDAASQATQNGFINSGFKAAAAIATMA